MWFDTWSDLLRVVLVGAAAYLTVVVLLRITGKRSLSQLNAFDFIVTVALGSTLATILLNDSVSWSEGAVALALLLLLQLAVALVTAAWSRLRRIITSEPVLVMEHGNLDRAALSRARLDESEVLQAIRGSGAGDVSKVAAVVLETNGKLSVISESRFGDGSALKSLKRA